MMGVFLPMGSMDNLPILLTGQVVDQAVLCLSLLVFFRVQAQSRLMEAMVIILLVVVVPVAG